MSKARYFANVQFDTRHVSLPDKVREMAEKRADQWNSFVLVFADLNRLGEVRCWTTSLPERPYPEGFKLTHLIGPRQAGPMS